MIDLPAFVPTKKKKTGSALLIEGGGMKGAFTGGVLTAMATNFPASNFDLVLAVSAGACSASYYVTEQPGEYLPIYKLTEIWRVELAGKKLINPWKMLTGHYLLNQSYLIDKLFRKKYPVKTHKLRDPNTTPLYVTVSNLQTAEPEYIRASAENLFDLLKAATALPIVTKGRQTLDFQKYGDGAILDPLPIKKLIQSGYKKVTIILNNPLDFYYQPYGKVISFLSYPSRPLLARKMYLDSHKRYNEAKDILNNAPKDCQFTILAPDTAEMSLLESNSEKLNRMINEGIALATKVLKRKK